MKHFKHLLFLSILCSLVLFTNCGEDSEDPVADDTTDTTGDINTDDDSSETTDDNDECTMIIEAGAAPLSSNGFTIIANEDAEIGKTYSFNNQNYLIADNEIFRFRDQYSCIDPLTGYPMDRLVTTFVTDMSYAFDSDLYNFFNSIQYSMHINDDSYSEISSWDMSNVTNMENMFSGVNPNEPGNLGFEFWDVSNVTNMSNMFSNYYDPLTLVGIENWDVSSVTDMSYMFMNVSFFNIDLSTWDVDAVTNCTDFNLDATAWTKSKPKFTNCLTGVEEFIYLDENGVTVKATEGAVTGSVYGLDGVSYLVVGNELLSNMITSGEDVTKVVTTNVTNMSGVFYDANYFNQDISSWDVSSVTDMGSMFSRSGFNGDISNWDVSNVTDMGSMFSRSGFNGDISNWDVSNVTDMSNMFFLSEFNGDISNWDVSNVKNMGAMLRDNTAFNQEIGSWDVSSVTDMGSMFSNSGLYGDISNWDVSNVTDMSNMFWGAESFNQDISSWDVSNVTNMRQMFSFTTSFNQDLSSWDVSKVTDCNQFSYEATAWTEPKPTFTNCTE